ncbi:MAG: N-acetyltransferase [Pseudolysinimonas sp.]
MSEAVIRDAVAADFDIMAVALTYAADWNGERPVSPAEALTRADLAKYLGGWPRRGDVGVIADVGGRGAGAAWARLLSADDPGYGWVADDIPELTMGVEPAMRGRGIGSDLLETLIDRLRAVVPALSLSVEDGNAGARAVYERAGFVPVGRVGGSDTMLLRF